MSGKGQVPVAVAVPVPAQAYAVPQQSYQNPPQQSYQQYGQPAVISSHPQQVVIVRQNVTNVPPGAPPGGHWVDDSYCGLITWCIFCFLCWCIVCCPVDKKQVYVAPNGRKYNADGTSAGGLFG